MGTATRAGLRAPQTRAAPAAALSEAGGGWRRRRHALAPYWFLLPYLLVFAVFWCWPIIDSALLSLQNTRVNPWAWNIGINWRRLLVDRAFQEALKNTLIILVVQVPVMLVLATLLALALNSPLLKLRPIYRFAFFAPVVVSDVAYSVVFRLLFNGQFGAVNHGLAALGLAPIDWLHDPDAAMADDHGGGDLALDRLQRDHPPGRAAVDPARPVRGGGDRRRLPGRPLLPHHPAAAEADRGVLPGAVDHRHHAAVHRALADHRRGGPGGATETLGTYLYKQGFVSLNFGYAAAIAYTIAAMAAVMAALNLMLTRGRKA